MPTYKANLRMVINFDVEVEAADEGEAMFCLEMQDDPSAERTMLDVIAAFDPDPEDIKAGAPIVRYFKEVRDG